MINKAYRPNGLKAFFLHQHGFANVLQKMGELIHPFCCQCKYYSQKNWGSSFHCENRDEYLRSVFPLNLMVRWEWLVLVGANIYP
jgi:hypothetical protein